MCGETEEGIVRSLRRPSPKSPPAPPSPIEVGAPQKTRNNPGRSGLFFIHKSPLRTLQASILSLMSSSLFLEGKSQNCCLCSNSMLFAVRCWRRCWRFAVIEERYQQQLFLKVRWRYSVRLRRKRTPTPGVLYSLWKD